MLTWAVVALALVVGYTYRDRLLAVGHQVLGELLPTISLQGTLSHAYEQQNLRTTRDAAQILAVLSMPLYTSGSVEARVRAALIAHAGRLITWDADGMPRVMDAFQTYLSGKLEDYEYPSEAIEASLKRLPRVSVPA